MVERSTDGRSYHAIGTVASANTAGIHQYSFTDANVISLDAAIVYYRLKQKDIDGRFTYSKIVALLIEDRSNLVLFYPNPVINEANLTIAINQPEQVWSRIIDNTGRVVKQQQWSLFAGSTSLSLDVKGLAKGMYYLELKGNNVINKRLKFLKK
jgi:trimeric autotransporter adhesin